VPSKSVAAPPEPNFTFRYGIRWPKKYGDLEIEFFAYRYSLPNSWTAPNEQDLAAKLKVHGLGAPAHFKRISRVLFPSFIWHPWADDMLEAACENKYLAVAGCSHIGKSEFAGVWAIGNYVVWPQNTLVLVTSTTLRDAKKRVWGAVQRYWQKAPSLPGKMVDAPTPAIRFRDENGLVYDSRGVFLIPSDAKKSAEMSSKMQGMKAPRVFLVADELAQLSDSLLSVARSNLNNNDFFHMVGFANPESYYDPFGKFAKPKNGWSSITVEDEEWETEWGGKCIHFDSLKSPNWLLGEDKWPIVKCEKIDSARKSPEAGGLGENSPEFWKMYRGFWCPTGQVQAIFTEPELDRFGAVEPVTWASDYINLAGCDLAFSSEGDRTIIIHARYGKDIHGKDVILYTPHRVLVEDVTNLKEPRDFQIARQIIAFCQEFKVEPANLSLDCTGAGSPFASIVEQLWGGSVHRVDFGGRASATPARDGRPAHELYANRVSEIWYSGLEVLRGGHIRGVYQELAREMCLRKYERVGARVQVESKRDMRALGIKSPDIADAALLIVTQCRERLGLGGRVMVDAAPMAEKKDRKKLVARFNKLYVRKNR
jgi:hypothetical protein